MAEFTSFSIDNAVSKQIRKRHIKNTIFKSIGISVITFLSITLIFFIYSIAKMSIGGFFTTEILVSKQEIKNMEEIISKNIDIENINEVQWFKTTAKFSNYYKHKKNIIMNTIKL